MIYVNHVRMWPSWMDPSFSSLVKTFYHKTNQKSKRYVGRLLGSGYPRTKNCTNDLSWDHTYYAYTLKHQNYFLRNYMRESVEAIQERGP